MSGGMGLDDFLKPPDPGGSRKYISGKWKKDGSIIVALHTQPDREDKKIAWPTYTHGFMYRDTFTKKDSDEEKEVLRFTSFASPDPAEVHEQQYFREDGKTGPLRCPPKLDPFLLLREWLRDEIEAGRMKTDEVIFEWTDPQKNHQLTQWRAGELSRLVERGRNNWSHSLDTKRGYLFLVCDCSHPENETQIIRATSGLGDAMREAIGQQIESNGVEGGNPLITPYAFKWKYDEDAKSFGDRYKAFRFNGQEITDEILAVIESTDYPNPDPDTAPKPGDKAKIRAAFEDAAQIELPWELLFRGTWGESNDGDASFNPEDFDDDAPKEKPKTRSRKRAPDVTTSEPKPSPREESADKPRRRKKKSKPVWWVEADERVDCDDCGLPMHGQWPKCPRCGAEYEVDGEVKTPPPMEALHRAGWPVPKLDNPSPDDEADEEPEDFEEGDESGDTTTCWACQAPVPAGAETCQQCGVDPGDDITY